MFCTYDFFFFKQKTAYDMRISDWSSDLCSSDLLGRQRMWLIPRRTNGLGSGRIPLPQPVRDALVRWYAGKGSRHDEEAGIMLVQQARIGEKWIACDCLQSGESPPILTPAFLSEAETYYLRRLTSTDRPEHHP